MRTCSVLAAVVAATIVCVSSPVAAGDLPPDQHVVYNIREVPSDPQSAVVFDVRLTLSAQSVDGNSVGWRIERIECWRTIDGVVTVWTENTPALASADGLWWVEHADAAAPQIGEFAAPPLLEGTAVAEDPQQPALDYSLAGVRLAEPSGVPYANATALTFALTLANESQPLKAGDDEPVEIDDHPVGTTS